MQVKQCTIKQAKCDDDIISELISNPDPRFLKQLISELIKKYGEFDILQYSDYDPEDDQKDYDGCYLILHPNKVVKSVKKLRQNLQEYDGKKYYIRHFKTPDHTIKNDCLIRALVEVTGKTYYNICQKLKAPYEVGGKGGWHHSVNEDYIGTNLAVYEKAFKDIIEDKIEISSNPYNWLNICHEAKDGKLPTVKQFAKVWSRRKQYAKKKLILHTFSPNDKIYHSIYCKNGYYYDSNNADDNLVVRVDIFS